MSQIKEYKKHYIFWHIAGLSLSHVLLSSFILFMKVKMANQGQGYKDQILFVLQSLLMKYEGLTPPYLFQPPCPLFVPKKYNPLTPFIKGDIRKVPLRKGGFRGLYATQTNLNLLGVCVWFYTEKLLDIISIRL